MEDDLAPARGIVLACIGGLAFWTTVALVMLWGATAGNAVWVLLHGAASADGGRFLASLSASPVNRVSSRLASCHDACHKMEHRLADGGKKY